MTSPSPAAGIPDCPSSPGSLQGKGESGYKEAAFSQGSASSPVVAGLQRQYEEQAEPHGSQAQDLTKWGLKRPLAKPVFPTIQ